MSDYVKRLRDARNWFDDGRCCGQLDSAGVCAAPACIFGEALKEFYQAADRIEELEEELSIWRSVFPEIAPERVLPDRRLLLDRIAELEAALRNIAADCEAECPYWSIQDDARAALAGGKKDA